MCPLCAPITSCRVVTRGTIRNNAPVPARSIRLADEPRPTCNRRAGNDIQRGRATRNIRNRRISGRRGMGEVYGVPPSDPRSLAAAAIFVVLVAAVAIAIPVARATHCEPAAALRASSREGISNPWATESKAPSASVRTYKAILTPTLHARAISVVPTTARIYPSYTRSTQSR
jgi:hypothetical protein